MIKLSQGNIRLNAQARDKTEAIRIAGRLLVDGGNMQSGYIESMLAREKVANTYLGNGIAIPHGLPRDRELILETGISVTQFPDGVQWNPGETVHLVVAIAARSDEHIELLANLTDVLDDPQTVQRLAQTREPLDIIERLTQPRDGGAVGAGAPAEAADDFAKWVDVVLTGPAGLHARPAPRWSTSPSSSVGGARPPREQGGQRQESGVAAEARRRPAGHSAHHGAGRR
jgi:mannitol/fructose-specific phosphotransferase system IIA component